MNKPPIVHILDANRRDLEDAFFSKQDARLIEQLRIMEQMKENKDALRKVSGIVNEAVLEKLISLNIRPETVASLAMVPLVEVAWADSKIDAGERDAMLKAIICKGIVPGSIDYELIESWLKHRPPAKMLDAWTHYIQGLCEILSAEEITSLKNELVGHARAIAEASGGFIGLGKKTSKAEQAILDTLTAAFTKLQCR